MSTLVAEEELESTRGERWLALLFATFLVIGLLWGYAKLDEPFRPSQVEVMAPAFETRGPAQRANDIALTEVGRARSELDSANLELEQSREAYRTALDAGQPALELGEVYQEAQARERRAAAAVSAAEQRLTVTEGPARAETDRLDDERSAEENRAQRLTFLVRLPYTLGTLGLSFWLVARYRRRRGRRMPLFAAGLGATTVLSLVMAFDYASNYVNLTDLGPVLISVVGVILSLAAFLALQRTLVRRIPARRVRRGECPFCGYPVRLGADGTSAAFCEGCGRDVVGECTACRQPRRVGAAYCACCGQP